MNNSYALFFHLYKREIHRVSHQSYRILINDKEIYSVVSEYLGLEKWTIWKKRRHGRRRHKVFKENNDIDLKIKSRKYTKGILYIWFIRSTTSFFILLCFI